MSIDETKLLFEGFLQKRKDTMKMKWATYWFRLQNTTLFFYTKKNGNALNLRGNYYIYTVQSVREVQRDDSKRFMFEIIMTSGKRKLLAAETAALRQEWLWYLWQAMQLSASRASVSSSTHLTEECEQRERATSIAPVSSHCSDKEVTLPARPLSVPAATSHIYHHHHTRSIASPVSHISPTPPVPPVPHQSEELSSQETMYQNTVPTFNSHEDSGDSPNRPQWSSEVNNTEGQEGHYDILPIRKNMCEINTSTDTDEQVYDIPVSYRRSADHPDPKESIYDVPSSLLRTIADNASEETPEDRIYWRI